jgi:hypothetical protein
VLRIWRANPVKAGDDLAELIAGLPDGMRSTLVHAATKAGRRKLGYVVEHGEELVASKARVIAHGLAEGARARVPQEAPYEEDKMLARLIREALFHRDSERRHLAALLIATSPFGEAVTEARLVVRGGTGYPEWMRTRAATLVRYLSTDAHRLRMITFLHDPCEDVAVPIAQGLGHLTPSPLSDQALRNSLGKEPTPQQQAKMYALGMTGSEGLETLLKSSDAVEWQKSAARWWIAQGGAIRA